MKRSGLVSACIILFLLVACGGAKGVAVVETAIPEDTAPGVNMETECTGNEPVFPPCIHSAFLKAPSRECSIGTVLDYSDGFMGTDASCKMGSTPEGATVSLRLRSPTINQLWVQWQYGYMILDETGPDERLLKFGGISVSMKPVGETQGQGDFVWSNTWEIVARQIPESLPFPDGLFQERFIFQKERSIFPQLYIAKSDQGEVVAIGYDSGYVKAVILANSTTAWQETLEPILLNSGESVVLDLHIDGTRKTYTFKDWGEYISISQ